MARKRDVSALSPAYRARLERAAAKQGVSFEQLRASKDLQRAARGHGRTPEHGAKPTITPREEGKGLKSQYGAGKKKMVNGRETIPTLSVDEAEKAPPPSPASVLNALKHVTGEHIVMSVMMRMEVGSGEMEVRWLSVVVRRDSIIEAMRELRPGWQRLSYADRHRAMIERIVKAFMAELLTAEAQHYSPSGFVDRVLGFAFAESQEG